MYYRWNRRWIIRSPWMGVTAPPPMHWNCQFKLCFSGLEDPCHVNTKQDYETTLLTTEVHSLMRPAPQPNVTWNRNSTVRTTQITTAQARVRYCVRYHSVYRWTLWALLCPFPIEDEERWTAPLDIRLVPPGLNMDVVWASITLILQIPFVIYELW